MVLLCDIIRFIDNKEILTALVELLKDKRESYLSPRRLSDAPQDPNVPTTAKERVCDIALISLKTKAGIDLGIRSALNADPDLFNYVHFTDEELAQAYSLLKKHFALS